MSNKVFWKKVKSLAIISIGGTACFAGINIFQGNAKFYSQVLMPTLHYTFQPETAHSIGLFAAKWGLIPRSKIPDGPIMKTTAFGLDFPNPIGIAAGFDKDAEAPSGIFKTGIGFLEIGSVTPLPQDGNPKPRIFRLIEDGAVINRCGFNSKGHQHVKFNLKLKGKKGIIGVNLGKNKDSVEKSDSAEDDYVKGINEFSLLADYFVINVSSPNTPGLRSLQKADTLEKLLDKVVEARDSIHFRKPPILLKIAPDLSHDEKKEIAQVILKKKKRIDGLIISNTTTSRPDFLKSENKNETGGLSGKPLHQISTEAIRDMYSLTKGVLPIIGVGGVFSGRDAYEKIKAGASLIQLYTVLIFEGPPAVAKIKRELQDLLISDGYTNISEAVGADHRPKKRS